MGVNSWSTPSNSANTTKTSKGINSWSTPPSDVNPAKVLKGVTPLYTIKQQEQEAQEKEPTLLDKVYLSSAKQKQSTGADLNVPEIGVTMKYNVEPVKNPKNISQAINYKAELDKKETEKFEKAIQKTDDFSISGKALTDLSGITDKKTYQNIINREGIYQYMTDDERRIYKYLIAKKDNASARKYLLDKMSDLESRKAYAVAGSDEGGFIGTVKDFSTAAKSGLESGLTNMARMGVAGNIAAGNNMGVLNKLLEPTYSEKLYELVRANANNKSYVYGILLDVTNSVSAQIPQIAMGAAGGSGAYLSAMAQQIIGADTTEAINQGYDGMRGVVYGIFDTALEFSTEKVLGGIASRLDGGETSRLVRAALNAVDSTVSNKKVANALAKTISILSSMNSEGVEEFLQTIIEPVMRNVIYGEKNNINADTFEEAVRVYIIGALSGGIMSLPFINHSLANTRADITGKFLKENAGVESVLKLSEVVGNNSELYGEIKSSFDGGRDVSNTDLAMLYQQSAIMFEQPSEETYKNFAERNVDALIKEAVNRQSNENSPDSESAKYTAESATQTDTVNSENETSDLQSTAEADNSDNAVFHEPDSRDIAEKLDPYDKYNTKENGYQVKDSRQRHIERVTNKLGAKITWSEDVKRGKYIPSERRIVLNPNMKTSEMYNFVFKHEFTHFLEGKQGYTDFKNYVFEKSALFEKWARERLAKNGIDSTGSREEVIKRLTQVQYEAYRNSDELSKVMRDRFSMNDAEAEVLADFVGENLLGTGDRLEQTLYELGSLEKKHRGIIQRIRDFISDLIARYRNEKRFGGLVKDLEYLNDRLKRVAESSDKKISDNETEKYSFAGYAEDGKGKYNSNFPKGTPKAAKAERILSYIQDVWSKKPIKLNITDNEGNVIKTIEAHFDPTYDESGNIPTDASKLMGGNRHGTAAEQRVTLDLADDYYQIAAESKYNYSKAETGKDNPAHKDVTQWHYFVNDIYFSEYGSEEYEPYRVSINVKEKPDGNFVYSFSAEKQKEHSTHQTLHADVNNGDNSAANAKLFKDIISEEDMSVNTSISDNSENDVGLQLMCYKDRK